MFLSMRRVLPLLVLGLVSVTGCAAGADESAPAASSSHIETARTDAQVKDAIEQAAKGAIFVSESDEPYTFVSAPLAGETELTEAMVIEKLGSFVDNPDGEKLHAVGTKFAEFWNYENCGEDEFPGPKECAKDKILHDALEANLKQLKVFYVAPYEDPTGDGVPTIFVVGITPSGNLAGVFTRAVWT